MLRPFGRLWTWSLTILVVAGAIRGGTAQQVPTAPATQALAQRIQPWLQLQLDRADATTMLPVYVVLAERLQRSHWFPRVLGMSLAVRRRTVTTELRAHAERSQAELLALLARATLAGDATAARSNWLGNFVQIRATPAVIAAAASLPGIESVWADVDPEPAAVADGHANAALPAEVVPFQPTIDLVAPPIPAPGDGPVATRAAIAWFYGALGQGIVIANLDGGMTAHRDLDGRRWTNPGEIASNGIDDDGNGFVDDVHGWAFDTNTAGFDDGGGHGTMTAGLLVGDGTCSGIATGQAPAAQIMTCRVLSETSHWNAVQYAVAMNADVQTSSFSYKAYFAPPPNYKLHRDVADASLAAGLIRLNSTGNDGAFCAVPTHAARLPCNIAAPACVPSPYRAPEQPGTGATSGVIAVGAWDLAAATLDPDSPCGPFAWDLADLRNNVPSYPASAWDSLHHDDYPWHGGQSPALLKPDVLGPAHSTTTTVGPCGTIPFSGTSNATPCVAGTVAIWKSANPSLGPEDVALLLEQTAQDRGPTAGKENGYGAGFVDAERGLLRALCLLRVDGQAVWQLEHTLQNGHVAVAVDGAPNALCAVLVGTSRSPGGVGPLALGIGTTVGLLFYGVTDGNGDLAQTVDVASNAAGQQFVAQAVLWDQTFTQRVLDSNVIGLTFTP